MHPHHRNLSGFPVLDVLQLIRSEHVGPVTFFNLLAYYGSPAKAVEAIPDLAKRGGRKKPLKACPRGEAEAELDALKRYGATPVVYGAPAYPPLLKQIYDAPPLLACLGDTALLSRERSLGVVGARNASANGCAFIKTLSGELGAQGHVIASGLARGIDTAAHLGSVETGTIAVIAGGIDHIYPPENEPLYRRIAEQGAIIAEAPFGAAPQARHFPARNRIIAGLSAGLIVAEASLRSGSLITAHYALDYGREVFAVPGSPLDPRSKGGNELLKNGATLIESATDVTQNLCADSLLKEDGAGADFAPAAPAPLPEAELDAVRATLHEKLGAEPVLLDELLAQCETTPHILHRLLLELELAGRLSRHDGGRVSLKYEAE